MVSVLTRRGLASPYTERSLPDGRRIFWKVVRPEHEVIIPAGCAVDEPVLDVAKRRGLAGVGLLRVGTNDKLWAPLSRWQRGIPIRRGFGRQRELLWHQLEPVPGENGEQLPLFEDMAR